MVKEQNRENNIIQLIKDKFPAVIDRLETALDGTVITLTRDSGSDFLTLCQFLHDQPDISLNFLSFVTAIDNLHAIPPPAHGCRYEVVYQLFSVKNGNHVRLKVPLDERHGQLKVASVTPVWKTAELFENEVFDMFGVNFEGHPDLRRMYMPDDWDGHPLRKDYPLKGQR